MYYDDKEIDVICQHTKNGKIIPLRIKLEDEEGINREYNVVAYKEIDDNCFVCRIEVFNKYKDIRIIYLVNQQRFIYRPDPI